MKKFEQSTRFSEEHAPRRFRNCSPGFSVTAEQMQVVLTKEVSEK